MIRLEDVFAEKRHSGIEASGEIESIPATTEKKKRCRSREAISPRHQWSLHSFLGEERRMTTIDCRNEAKQSQRPFFTEDESNHPIGQNEEVDKCRRHFPSLFAQESRRRRRCSIAIELWQFQRLNRRKDLFQFQCRRNEASSSVAEVCSTSVVFLIPRVNRYSLNDSQMDSWQSEQWRIFIEGKLRPSDTIVFECKYHSFQNDERRERVPSLMLSNPWTRNMVKHDVIPIIYMIFCVVKMMTTSNTSNLPWWNGQNHWCICESCSDFSSCIHANDFFLHETNLMQSVRHRIQGASSHEMH